MLIALRIAVYFVIKLQDLKPTKSLFLGENSYFFIVCLLHVSTPFWAIS
jgi:hypothetical protein